MTTDETARELRELRRLCDAVERIAATQERILRLLDECVGTMDNRRKFIRTSRVAQ